LLLPQKVILHRDFGYTKRFKKCFFSRVHIHPSIALQDFDQALALKQQEATVGERLQKAKIRCQATEATKPIDLEEVHL